MKLTALTAYEARVVSEIAAWTASSSQPYSRWTSRLTKPVLTAFGRLVPKSVARRGIESALATPAWLSNKREILDKAHVATFDQLLHKPLEFCDRLAEQVARGSHTMAVIDGVVAGTGGFLLATAEVGALSRAIPAGHPSDQLLLRL